jgi:hypothetical protein
MTCIVGIRDSIGNVWMGADSFAGEEHYSLRADPKLFRKKLSSPHLDIPKTEMLIGYTTSYRMGQILQYHVEAEYWPGMGEALFSWHAWLILSFIESVRKAFKDYGYSEIKDAREAGGCFMIGIGGRLFTIYSDFQMEERHAGYSAVGSGSAYALGSLHTSELDNAAGPVRRIELALEAAQAGCSYVREPFIIEELRKGA